jgi:hypothetical protein
VKVNQLANLIATGTHLHLQVCQPLFFYSRHRSLVTHTALVDDRNATSSDATRQHDGSVWRGDAGAKGAFAHYPWLLLDLPAKQHAQEESALLEDNSSIIDAMKNLCHDRGATIERLTQMHVAEIEKLKQSHAVQLAGLRKGNLFRKEMKAAESVELKGLRAENKLLHEKVEATESVGCAVCERSSNADRCRHCLMSELKRHVSGTLSRSS